MSLAGRAQLGSAVVLLASACAPATPSSTVTVAADAGSSSPGGTARVEPAWQVLEGAPFARLEMAVTAHRGQIWLAGGLSPQGEALGDVEIFDPASGEWSDGPSLPSSVHHAALVSEGGRLVLIGGYLGSDFSRPSRQVLVLADGDDAWREGPALPEPRAAGAAAWDGERTLFAGGVGASGVAADVYALSANMWQRIGAMAAQREHLAAASDGAGSVWLLGGRVGGLDANLATVEVVAGTSITRLNPLPTARGGVAAFHDPSVGACLIGGETPDGALRTAECITRDGTVSILPDLNEAHHGHGAAVIDGVAYVLLGGPVPGLSAGPTVEALELGP